MESSAYHTALDLLILSTTVAAALIAFRHLFRLAPPTTEPTLDRRPVLLPWLGLLAVCALLLINQLLFNVFVAKVHGGDPTFVRRYVGGGWFTLALDSAPVRWLDAHLAPATVRGPLAFTVFRVQAVLELPFVLGAYLAIAALISRRAYRFLLESALFPLACISFTATFSAIEARLWNPWTRTDLACRVVICAVFCAGFALARVRRRKEPAPDRETTSSALALLAGLVGAAAIAHLVLACYDAFLLYNLGHLAGLLPWMLCDTTVATLALLIVPRLRFGGAALPSIHLGARVLAAFTVTFFAPSLAIRYGLFRPVAAPAAALLLLMALIAGSRRAANDLSSVRFGVWRGWLGVAIGLGVGILIAATNGFGLLPPLRFELAELVLLRVAATTLLPALLIARLADSLLNKSQ